METIKRILNITLRAAEVIFLVFTIYGFYYAKQQEYIGDKAAGVMIALMCIVLLAVCIGIEILKVGYRYRCPWCKKWFALKKKNREYIGSEKISVAVSTLSEEYSRDGQKTGRYSVGEQYVPGVKKIYHINYICKKCGKSSYTTEYIRNASV